MKFNLVIDGTYILNKNVFALKKINELGNLEASLEATINSFVSWYGFTKVYLVSDSGSSWRKQLYPDYKGNRVKNNDIDWDFVYKSYNNFKKNLHPRVKKLSRNNIEGDDWISHLINMNSDSCTLIISNDHDLKQLIKFTTSPTSLVFMANEMFSSPKVFLPYNYKMFLNHVRSNMSDNIFELNDESEFLSFINKFILKREIILVNYIEEYITKLLKGDKSDNIKSVYNSITPSGRLMGIGDVGAKKIYESYTKEFGEVNLNDKELFENLADLVCVAKKLSYNKIPLIKKNLELNTKLINLINLPSSVIKAMSDEMNQKNVNGY